MGMASRIKIKIQTITWYKQEQSNIIFFDDIYFSGVKLVGEAYMTQEDSCIQVNTSHNGFYLFFSGVGGILARKVLFHHVY